MRLRTFSFLFTALNLFCTVFAAVPLISCDIDNDGLVDFSDICIMAEHWLGTENIEPQLLGYWKFDETSGMTASDFSGNSVAAILHNGVLWQPSGGRIKGALSFDGSNDLVQTYNSTTNLQLTGDYTLSFWLKAHAVQNNWAGIIVKTPPDGSVNHWAVQFDDSSDRKLVIFHSSDSYETGIKLSDLSSDWHHIALVRTGNVMTTYFDAAPVKSSQWTASPCSGSGHLNIGTDRGLWCFFKGLLDELRIYDCALTDSEIRYLATFPADITGDDTVNFEDFSLLAGQWQYPAGRQRPLENGNQLLLDTFDLPDSSWQPIYLQGTSGGSSGVSAGKLYLNAASSDTVYGLYNTTAVSGHFYVQADFNDDDYCGLALIWEKDGQPDTQNFTSVNVMTDSFGKAVVSVKDRQNGIEDVLDNTYSISSGRFQTVLDAGTYSVPFTGTNKKIRIFRDAQSGFFHFYYAVKKYIKGQYAEGWMELAPSKGWGSLGQKYYIALIVRSGSAASGQAVFDNVSAMQKPASDRNDSRSGFKILQGEYNWSGFFGNATVITFGDEFAFSSRDCKFVFFSELNNIPAWHIDNQCLCSYEFIETWGNEIAGSFEPMSDRLLRWSSVEILEDNAVRKIVHWHYVLCNPDYRVPDDATGTQLPEGDEYWTFYPDGTGVREIIYTPKLDSDFRNPHELSELLVIAGSATDPCEHLSSPALTVMNLTGDADDYFPNKAFNPQTNQWPQIIASTHFKTGLDAFAVFSHSDDIPATYCHYDLYFDISWHAADYEFCHWPVGREPYQLADKTNGTWKAQASHTSLMSVGVYDGTDWGSHYQIDAGGRKYRSWLSLVGLSGANDTSFLCNITKTWLYPGSIMVMDANSEYVGLNYKRKEIVFNNTGSSHICHFTFDPTLHSAAVINPVFKIASWSDNPVFVQFNGRQLTAGSEFRYAIINGDAIVWLRASFSEASQFLIRDY